MNSEHDVQVHRLDGLVVVIDESISTADETTSDATKGEQTVRGDELQEAGKLLKVAEALETKHMDQEAGVVKEHVRDLVAKQLNEFDGFDR